jgi:hypothetical protein
VRLPNSATLLNFSALTKSFSPPLIWRITFIALRVVDFNIAISGLGYSNTASGGATKRVAMITQKTVKTPKI